MGAKAEDEIARLKADAEMPIEDLVRMHAQQQRQEEEGTESCASLSDNSYISNNIDDSSSSRGEDEELDEANAVGAPFGGGSAGLLAEEDVVVEERRSSRPVRRRRSTKFGTVDTSAASGIGSSSGAVGEGKRLVREVLPWRSGVDGEADKEGSDEEKCGESFKDSEQNVREEHMHRSMSESMSLSSEDEEGEGTGNGDPDVDLDDDDDDDAEFEFRDEVDDETTLEAEVGWDGKKIGIELRWDENFPVACGGSVPPPPVSTVHA